MFWLAVTFGLSIVKGEDEITQLMLQNCNLLRSSFYYKSLHLETKCIYWSSLNEDRTQICLMVKIILRLFIHATIEPIHQRFYRLVKLMGPIYPRIHVASLWRERTLFAKYVCMEQTVNDPCLESEHFLRPLLIVRLMEPIHQIF